MKNRKMAANRAAEMMFFLKMIDMYVVDVLYIFVLLIILLQEDALVLKSQNDVVLVSLRLLRNSQCPLRCPP